MFYRKHKTINDKLCQNTKEAQTYVANITEYKNTRIPCTIIHYKVLTTRTIAFNKPYYVQLLA